MSLHKLGAATAAALVLVACNGGGGGDSPPVPPAPVSISGVVADGPLSGATVCYDLNDNDACDAGEPVSGATDADGRYTLDVPADAAGKHAIIANVPATAVDKDTGQTVGAAIVLKSPRTGATGDQTVFVSALTTLVADAVRTRGIEPEAAAAEVQGLLGLTASPLANFVAAADTQAATAAATVNRIIVEVTKVASEAGVTGADLSALLAATTSGDLPGLAARVASAAAPGEGGAPTPAEVAASVAASVLTDRNLTPDTVVAQAAVAGQVAAAPPVASAAAPGPFISVRSFSYTNASNHSYRVFTGDSSVVDADGAFAANDVRLNKVNAVDQSFNRNTAYWTGSAWHVCERAYAVISSVAATATRPQRSVFCNASRSETRTASVSVAGRPMAEVVTEMRAFPLPDGNNGLPTAWGPDPALLGSAVFPAGAELQTREQTGDIGNTDRFSLTDKPRIVPASGSGTYRHAPVLEDLARMSGDLVTTSATVTNLNTLFVDDQIVPQPADAALDARARYRVALTPAGNAARFYRCDVLRSNNTSLNCVTLGDGSAAVEARGDTRVLRFSSGYPAALITAFSRQRIFVEREGVVFNGYTDLQRISYHQRLNTAGWIALRDQLGIPAHVEPAAPAANGPFETLRRLTFADANNFFARLFFGDSSVLDSEGFFTASESRTSVVGGVLQSNARNALYWDGTQWYDCPAPTDGPDGAPVVIRQSSVAPFTSTFCRAYVDERASRSVVTLDGRNMAEVVRDIRWYPSLDGTFSFAGWGPNPDAAGSPLATATFPAGSTLEYRVQRGVATPLAISTNDSARVRVPPAGTPGDFNTWPFAATVEDLIAAYAGDLKGGTLNGNTAFFVHDYVPAVPPAAGFGPRVQIRVAFDATGNRVRFYQNNTDASTGFTTNYVTLGDTTYTVETVGDARVLRFAAMPDGFEAQFRFARLFVERGGIVRYGFKDSLGLSYSIRLNGPATEALATVLGIN